MLEILEAYNNNKESYDLKTIKDFKINYKDPEQEKLTFLTSKKHLKQYTDEYLYQAEIHFLKWAKEKLKDEAWCNSQRLRKYTFGMLIQEIFGRPYDPKIDGGRLSTSHMFAHYCSRVTKCYWDWRKEITRNTPGYCISISRIKEVKPYSLRLQAEQIMKQGKVPTKYNVKFKKNLKPGHAHNYKREAAMKVRQERGRQVYERTKEKQQ